MRSAHAEPFAAQTVYRCMWHTELSGYTTTCGWLWNTFSGKGLWHPANLPMLHFVLVAFEDKDGRASLWFSWPYAPLATQHTGCQRRFGWSKMFYLVLTFPEGYLPTWVHVQTAGSDLCVPRGVRGLSLCSGARRTLLRAGRTYVHTYCRVR